MDRVLDPAAPDAPASQRDWPPTRAEGLRRLTLFRPRMGAWYAARRNHDLGPDARGNVSLLSPYVRRRLLLESELVQAALTAHSAAACDKFVQEVFWRSYWKGWLQMRPAVWTAYRDGLAGDRAAAGDDRRLSRALAAAEQGRTGIDCMDAWTAELVGTGYLHNHARMWFASIWIFTLGLPWRLGADFFLRHLLDGDPASNTLGWRWVAGLHTQGKHYVANPGNIVKFTDGQFRPRGLVANAAPLPPDHTPPPLPPGPPDAPAPGLPSALLITEEDCRPEALGLDLSRMTAAAALLIPSARSDAPVSPLVGAFDRGALADAAARARDAGAPAAEMLVEIAPADLARWARRVGAAQIVTAEPPVGPVADFLAAAREPLAAAGVRLTAVRRPWDAHVWPCATAGFFKVKSQIPQLVQRLL
jgi:deoxyribodipyrimidine photo-lyase